LMLSINSRIILRNPNRRMRSTVGITDKVEARRRIISLLKARGIGVRMREVEIRSLRCSRRRGCMTSQGRRRRLVAGRSDG
jgi:hypothetical protein